MIVYCEECGHKNIIDKGCMADEKAQIPCVNCGESLRFYGLRAKALKASVEAARKPARMPSPAHLILKYKKVVVIVDQTRSRVEIGRQKSNDIQVSNNRASRTHAIVEYIDGSYYLTDQSSNGTYLLMEGSDGVTIKKKRVELTDNGFIGPGYKVTVKSTDAIEIIFEPTA